MSIHHIPVVSARGIKVTALNDFIQHLPSLDAKDSQDFEKILKKIRERKEGNNPWGLIDSALKK